ncbi:MAG: hypothetical protein JNN12_00665 [Bacteroidetes Order II. Incertae sedis bacterium]|nr:hypothetical protein [Bacteroidetes Order II. bacterium]
MRTIKSFIYILVWFLPVFALAQVNQSGTYINPNNGLRDWRTDINLTGNQVESIITNYGTIGKGNESINQAGVWPKGTGHGHLHQMSGWVGSRLLNKAGQRTVIISDGYTDGNTGPLAETDGKVEWKFQPKPGYLNRSIARPEVANSLNPSSWPTNWPGKDAQWNGKWNGFFGLNQFNADQEVYYVMDDFTNREFQVYPFGEADAERRGLGLQVDVRLFQWSQALAKDILFMQYEVSNVGNINYTSDLNNNPLFFGGYTDTNPSGAGATDDAAAFSKQRNLVFGWSSDGVGKWTQFREIAPGHVGWKFLESPSISNDAIDNDGDGLVDESRDNGAGSLVVSSCGIYGQPREHWSGDEDCDWNAKIDDKGTDGIGPGEEGYPGPDPDGTEGNKKPDQGEPNFGRLDKDESDQIGLTSFYAPLFGTVDIKEEEAMWPRMQPGFFDVPQQAVNQIWIFASGPFALPVNRTERFSTAFLWGANRDALYRTAQVAQRIYDADYRFARPPRQPELRAVAGDKQVTLLWDDLSEFSRDPIYGQDFEGYRIIKSTDPQFRDAKEVTDAFGNAVYKRSMAQFDKVNGLVGPHPLQFGEEIGLPNGIHYHMGDDNGLQHSFVDRDVVNGRTYYYAVIAYDAGYATDYFKRGISEIEDLFPISPSESPASITLTNGVVTKYDRNTVSVTPNKPASDLEIGKLQTEAGDWVKKAVGFSTAQVRAVALSGEILKDATYNITFDTKPLTNRPTVEYNTATFSVRTSDGRILADKVPVPTTADGTARTTWTHELLADGILLQFENAYPTESDTKKTSGWEANVKSNLKTEVEATASTAYPTAPIWPINAVIEFTQAVADTAWFSVNATRTVDTYFKVYDAVTKKSLDFMFAEPTETANGRIDVGEAIGLLFKDKPTDTRYTRAWTIRFLQPTDAEGKPLPTTQTVLPQSGDKYYLRTQVPFGKNDRFSFGSTATKQVANPDASLLDKVYVVPNPYVVGNTAETRPFLSGRGERKLFFRNLPAKSTVRIFTASGVFVREIEGANGTATWDLQTKDGLEVSYGLYFYLVKAEGVGEKTGKFAIVN